MLADLDLLLTAVFCIADELLPERPKSARRRVIDVECGRWLETARRSELADACGYGYCRSHSRWCWGMRLHLACAPDGTPRAAILAAADQQEREVALRLLPLALRGGEALICDKGYAGAEFEQAVRERFGASVLRPSRAHEPENGLHLSSIRQLVESVFWTLKDRLGLERHRARTLAGIRARVASKLLALAAGVWLNHLLGRPTRSFADLAVCGSCTCGREARALAPWLRRSLSSSARRQCLLFSGAVTSRRFGANGCGWRDSECEAADQRLIATRRPSLSMRMRNGRMPSSRKNSSVAVPAPRQ